MLYFYINDPLFVFRSAFRLSCEKKKKFAKRKIAEQNVPQIVPQN